VFEQLASSPASCELQQKLDQLLLGGDEYAEYMSWRSMRVICSSGADARGELSRLNARAQLQCRVRELMRQQGLRFETVFHLAVQREMREIDALLKQLQSVDLRLVEADSVPSPISALWFRRPVSAFLDSCAEPPRAQSPDELKRAQSPVLRTNASAPQLSLEPLEGALTAPRMSLSPTAAQLRSLRGSRSSALCVPAFSASPASSFVLQFTTSDQLLPTQRRSRESCSSHMMSVALSSSGASSSSALSWSSVLHESSDDPFLMARTPQKQQKQQRKQRKQEQESAPQWSCVLQRSSDCPMQRSADFAAPALERASGDVMERSFGDAAAAAAESERSFAALPVPEPLPATLIAESLTTPRTRARMARVMDALRASRGLIVRDLSDRAAELSARVRRAEIWLSLDAPKEATKSSLQSFIACARMMVAFVTYLRQMFEGEDTNALPVHAMWTEAQSLAELSDGALIFMQSECSSALDAASRAAQAAQRSLQEYEDAEDAYEGDAEDFGDEQFVVGDEEQFGVGDEEEDEFEGEY